jgi:3-hydroxyisobutyrate dehydrogenase-like beta-hydroxyacid dehydrogenase
MDKITRVGFVGLGVMGRRMVRNLMRAGFQLTVHNRSRAIVDELAKEGATPATSGAEVARASQVTISCLPRPEDVRLVHAGPGGILEGVQPGSIVIDMSTIDPKTHQDLAAAYKAKGADYLEAPVSGGVGGAERGTLTMMVGGDAAALERARPVFQAMGKRLYHLGPAGCGAAAKLINNMLCAINAAAVAEASILMMKAGLDPTQMMRDVIQNSSGTSSELADSADAFLARDFEPGFTVDLLLKDVLLGVDFAKAVGLSMNSATAAVQLLQRTKAEGMGGRSMYAWILPLERDAGIEVKPIG